MDDFLCDGCQKDIKCKDCIIHAIKRKEKMLKKFSR